MNFLPRTLDALADLGCRHSRSIVIASTLFVLASPFFLIGLELDADASRVIPYEDPVGLTYRDSRRLFGDTNLMIVELRYGAIAADELNHLTDRLAGELESWDDIEYVEARPLSLEDRAEAAARLRAALLNGAPELRAEFQRRFTESGMRRELLRARKRLIALDDPATRIVVAEDLLGLRDILAEFEKSRIGWRDRYAMSPYFDAPKGGSRLLLIQPRGSAEDNEYCRQILRKIDALMSEAKADVSDPSQLDYRVSGVHAMTGEATDVLYVDLRVITVAATVALFFLLWFAFGQLRATLICFLPLVVAQLGVLVIARFFFNPIHFLTVGFAAVVVGLGLDVGLHLTGRFAQFRATQSVNRAVRSTLTDCGPPVVIGSVSTAAAFLSLLVTENRGLVQFGLLTSLGLFLTLAVTLILFPALATLLATSTGKSATFGLRGAPRSLLQFVSNKPRTAFGIAAVLVVMSLPFAARFEFSRNVLQFFPDDMQSLDAGDEIAATHGHTLAAATQVLVKAPSLHQAMSMQRRVDEELAVLIADGTLTAFQSPSSYLAYGEVPSSWSDLAVDVQSGREIFFEQLAALRFRGTDDYGDYYDIFAAAVDSEAGDKPRELLSRVPRLAKHLHLADDGVTLQTQVALAPADGGLRAFDGPVRRQLTDTLRGIAPAGDGEIQVASLVQVYDRSNQLLLSDFAGVSWIAVALVGLVVVIFFRRIVPAALTFLPLAGALPVTLGLIHVMDVPIMPSAIGFAAIILGVGIDDAVHILARAHGGRPEEMPQVLEEIGTVITLTTASTMIGFGSLALSHLSVLSSLGIIIAVGVGACWLFSIFLLPAACRVVTRGASKPVVTGLLFALTLWPAASDAQTRSAEQLMDDMAATLDSVEAVACNIKQTKRLQQLDGAIALEGPLLFQKPHFIKLELSGDENISMFCDGESVWLVDRDLEEVETFELNAADRDRQLARLLPPLFYLSREQLEERFEIRSVAPAGDLGKHRIEMVPKIQGEFPFEVLHVDLGDSARVLRLQMMFENGDTVETELEGCQKRPRTSLTVFKYRESGEKP